MHGISKEKSRTEGINIKLAIELFNICLKETNILIAHNIQFDKNMIIWSLANLWPKQIPNFLDEG